MYHKRIHCRRPFNKLANLGEPTWRSSLVNWAGLAITGKSTAKQVWSVLYQHVIRENYQCSWLTNPRSGGPSFFFWKPDRRLLAYVRGTKPKRKRISILFILRLGVPPDQAKYELCTVMTSSYTESRIFCTLTLARNFYWSFTPFTLN